MNKRRKILVSAITLFSIVLSSTAFAAETKNFDGYNGYEGDAQISISNITGPSSLLTMTDIQTEGYNCDAPVVISTLVDGLVLYEAKQMVIIDNEFYYNGYQAPITGTVKQYTEDGSVVVPYSPDLEEMSYDFMKDSKMTITKPGMYHVLGRFGAIAGSVSVAINVTAKVSPTTAKIYVDGKEIECEAYNIDGNNYFKLRDVAKAINGSSKQFEVSWDQEKKSVNLKSNSPYTVVGKELTLGDGTAKLAQQSASNIYVDDEGTGFTAYTINDNNYFQLRELGTVFNFGVNWNPETKSIMIETDKEYTEEE